MVEYTLRLDSIFGSLADPTRRDILRRVSSQELSVSEVAQPYDVSLAAVSKHLGVLERAQLIVKRRRGKEHLIALSPGAFTDVVSYLRSYQAFTEANLDSLEAYLKEGEV